MVTAVKFEEKPPHQIITPIWVRVLASSEKVMCIIQRIDPNSLVSYMSPVIHQNNARSWDPLVISIQKAGLLRNVGMTPRPEINLIYSKRIILLVIMQWMKSSCNKKLSNLWRWITRKYCTWDLWEQYISYW